MRKKAETQITLDASVKEKDKIGITSKNVFREFPFLSTDIDRLLNDEEFKTKCAVIGLRLEIQRYTKSQSTKLQDLNADFVQQLTIDDLKSSTKDLLKNENEKLQIQLENQRRELERLRKQLKK